MEQVPGVVPVEDVDAEPIDDAEAEAVLGALGTQLTWKEEWGGDGHGFNSYLVYIGTGGRGDVYSVYSRPEVYSGKWLASRIASAVTPSSRSEVLHRTLKAAKAACERHHATGKWE